MAIPLREIREWPSEDILYYRIFTSVILTCVFIAIFRKKQLRRDYITLRTGPAVERKRFAGLMLAASVLIMGNWFAFIYAVNHVSIQSAAFAYLVCPLLTTLAGFLILKEQLSSIKKVSIGIALVSVLLLARGSLHEVMWSVGIASLYALYLIVQRVMPHIDKLNVLALQLALCSIAILPFILWQQHPIPVAPKFWYNIILISVLFTIIPLYLSMYALNGISSSTLGVLIYVNPIVSFAVAVVYFDEHIAANQLIAYLILLGAVMLFNWEVIRKMLRLSP